MSPDQIAAELGCPTQQVIVALRKAGLIGNDGPTLPRAKQNKGLLRDRRWLVDQYVARMRSMRDIAAEVGCCEQTVRKALHDASVPVRRGNTNLDPRLHDPDWLYQVGVAEGQSVDQIMGELGCGESTLYKAFYRYGVEAPRR